MQQSNETNQLEHQNLQFLANAFNPSRFNDCFNIQQLQQQQQQQQQQVNSHFLSKFLPKLTSNNNAFTLQNQMIMEPVDILMNKNFKSGSKHQFNSSNNQLFHTLIAANILRSNIQNSNNSPFLFKNMIQINGINTNLIDQSQTKMNNLNRVDNKKIAFKRFDYSKLAQECSKEIETKLNENMTEGTCFNNENKFQNTKSFKLYKNHKRLVFIIF